MMMMRFMTALALSGWLAFAAVWLHQPHGPATPAAAVLAPAMLVRDGGDGVPVGVGGGVVSSYPLARGPASTDSVIEIPLGKTPKLAGGTFLPPNAKPRGGSFAAGFPKQWGAPGTAHSRTARPPQHAPLLTPKLMAVAARLEEFSHASVSTAMDWHYAMVRAHGTSWHSTLSCA